MATEPTPEQLKVAARARVDRACALIERAQNDLDSACAELSTLVGGCTVWKATSTMGDRVKALWWKVHHFRMGARYKLDDMHVDALRRELARDDGTKARAVVDRVLGPALEWPR